MPETRHRSPVGFVILAAAALMLAGCGDRLLSFGTNEAAEVLQTIGAPQLHDGRVRFRQIVCALAERRAAEGKPCADCNTLLWRFADEDGPPPKPPPLPDHDPRLRILIVPGAFAECFPEYGIPFMDAARRLEPLGYRIGVIAVSGRGGADYNAAQIAAAVEHIEQEPGERLVMIGHSKGALDILHFLVDYPVPARRVSAVVSVAGAVNGSPLADAAAGIYDRLFSGVIFQHCEPADRGVMDSLRRSQQITWLSAHPLPAHVAYFSLVTFTRRADIHPLMLYGYDRLAAIDPRNDGYMLWTDQLIPGGTLLGYAALDHYDVALPVRERLNIDGSGSRAPERAVLIEAIVLTVAEALRMPAEGGRTP